MLMQPNELPQNYELMRDVAIWWHVVSTCSLPYETWQGHTVCTLYSIWAESTMENSIYDVGTFGAVDYVVLACMLSISAGIGIYYACTGGKQSTTKEFLLADRAMSPVPVAMSLVASFISAITVLGTPAEVYINGSMYWIFCFAYIIAGVTSSLFLPIFYRLKITSANEVINELLALV